MANCGNCMANDVEIVKLNEFGTCPRCATEYGPRFGNPAENVMVHKIPREKFDARKDAGRVEHGDSSAGPRQGE